MGKTLNKELKKFLKTVEADLICNKDERKKILSSLENDINIKVEEGTISTISDVIEVFGTPESIANAYQINKSDVVKLRNTRRIILRTVFIILAIIVACVAAYLLFEVIDSLGSDGGYYTVELTESTPIPQITGGIK